MAANDYEFLTTWRVPGTCEQVYDVLVEGIDYPRWWPQVYLDVVETDAGGPYGLGKSGTLHTRGWLPYTLRWESRVIEVRHPAGFTIEARGDFVGRGVWQFRQKGNEVEIQFDWRIRAEKPLLRRLSFLLKPVFTANHRWAMACGEEALKAELARRTSES